MKSKNTVINTKEDFTYLTYPSFTEIEFINHACSTRFGGISEGYFSTMNLGLTTDDDFKNIKKNWQFFCDNLNIDINDTVLSDQKHGDNILIVTKNHKGEGIVRERDYDNIDGLITNIEGIALCIFSADCIPVLFADVDKKVIGAAHCGRKGTYLDLSEKMIAKMINDFGCDAKNIKVAIGPGIKSCCYEVSEDLFLKFNEKYKVGCYKKHNKYYLDLPLINKYIIEKTGVKNIFVSDLCTCCNKDSLFSHRGSGGKRGLMVNLIQIKKTS